MRFLYFDKYINYKNKYKMSLIKVPTFSKLNNRNGTLYNFQNYNNDLTQSFANSSKFKREPSKFVCVKIPKWNNTTGRHIYLEPDKISTTPLETNPNILIPKLLQNYMENLDAYAVKEDIIDSNIPEMAFWKLMNTLGGVKLDSNTDGIIKDSYNDNDDFVKYIGNTNVVNYVEYGNRTYTELYIHIQHDAKRLTSLNWKNGASTQKSINMSRLPLLENGEDISLGLTDDPTQLTNAVYDFDTSGNTKQYYDFSLKSNKAIIDFPSAVSGTENEDFEFNAILLYYDTYELDSQGNEIGRSTKLGSVFFIDDFIQNPAGGYWEIPTTTKYNSDENNVLAGNAIAYRLCTTFFSSNEQMTVDTIVNQYNTVSMDLYVKALSEMMKTADYYQNNQQIIQDIVDRISKLNYGDDIYQKLLENQVKLEELTNTVNSVIGANGYTVTNFELLDAFAKLSQDFKGLNGQSVENTFVFGENSIGQTIQFNAPYTYIKNGKYSIGYSDESMLQIGLIRNKILSKYAVQHKAVGNVLNLKLSSTSDPMLYAVNGTVYSNALNNQEIQISFSPSDTVAMPYVLVINKSNGKFEIYDYPYMRTTALDNFAYVGHFILPTASSYDDNGLPSLETEDGGNRLETDIHVNLRDGENQGSYDTGDVIPAGTSIKDIIKKMLVDEKNLTYKEPELNIDFKTDMFVNKLSVIPFKYEVKQNDAGTVRDKLFTSNVYDISLVVDFVLGIIKIGQYEYSVTDGTQTGLKLNEMFTITEGTLQTGMFELKSNVLKISTTNTGTIYHATEDFTDDDGTVITVPKPFSDHAILMPNTTNQPITFNLKVNVDYNAPFGLSGLFLIPLMYTNSFTDLLITTKIEYDEGVIKYDYKGDEVAGHIVAGEKVFNSSYSANAPIVVYQATDTADVVDMSLLPHQPLFEQKRIYSLVVEENDSCFITFGVPQSLGYRPVLLSLFVDDILRSNLLASTRHSNAIKINNIDYFIDAYEIPAGFIGDNVVIKATYSMVDDYSTFDLSFEPTFK